MRIPPNSKYFIGFILAICIIALATIYLPRFIPHLSEIIIGIVTVSMCVLIFFIFLKPFITFLYARSDGIFKVYLDLGEKGFHVFSYHLNSAAEGMSGTRDIQHYFIIVETGKVYFRKMFSHDMTPSEGRSGWGDFYSFEESVEQSGHLKRSMEALSKKAGMNLSQGREISAYGTEEFEIRLRSLIIEIRKYSTVTDEGYKIICTDTNTGKLLWKRRI